EAVNIAARMIETGCGDVFIAGGVESMTRAPFVMAKAEEGYQRTFEMFDTTIGWRFTNPKLAKMYHPFSMGETAENVAEKWKISREDQDAFALASQRKYANAAECGRFSGGSSPSAGALSEIVPVAIPQRKGDPILVAKDEHPRSDTTLDSLAKLKP